MMKIAYPRQVRRQRRPRIVEYRTSGRIVLATGYPYVGYPRPYLQISMMQSVEPGPAVPLNFPEKLWRLNCPQYRLVLEPTRRYA
jgi:hypothetical protein